MTQVCAASSGMISARLPGSGRPARDGRQGRDNCTFRYRVMSRSRCCRSTHSIAVSWFVVSVFGPRAGFGIDWNISGMARQEIAYSIAGNNNEMNQMGNVFNARITPHYTHADWGTGANATVPTTTYIDDNGVAGFFQQGAVAALPVAPTAGQRDLRTVAAGVNTLSPVNCRYGNLNALAAGSGGLIGDGSFLGVACPNGGGTAYVPGVDAAIVGAAAAGVSAQGAALDDNINFNLFNTRFEVDVQAIFNPAFAAFVKFRAYADTTSRFTDGRIGNLFENPYWGTRSAIAEYSSPSVLVDLPAAYLDYHDGPLWIRLGNQTIAWGEAYFFRVMDVVNGLDLRRHLTLGPGGEEFKDQRIASPTLRVSYSLPNAWEVDTFASLFSPTILPPQNSPYSLIASGTSLDERDEFDDAAGAINFGVRLTMPLSEQFTLMAMYGNRRNPDGVFRYAEAPAFNAGIANGFCAGGANETNNLLTDFAGGPIVPGGPVLPAGPLQGAVAASGLDLMPSLLGNGHATLNHCGAALAPDPLAANSTEYWHIIGRTRLDPMKALRVAVDEFPATQWAARQIFGFGEETNVADALRTMEAFHSYFGGFRAWATREFKREQVFALGGNYITHVDDQASFWDSIIIRGEVAVTPDKQFTDLGLSRDYIEGTEIVSALIVEKFHRFSDAFPATYMVWQWMHREQSDLFGRHLSGTESVQFERFVDPVSGDFTAQAFVDGAAAPRGSNAADYVVFAFQQPSASLIWRLDLALLIDVEGGYLVQPGIRYRPSDAWQWDLYANLIEDGGDENDDVMESLDFADEVFVRMTYYF